MASFPKSNPIADGLPTVTGLRPLQYFEVDVNSTGGSNANLLSGTDPGGAVSTLLQTIEMNSTIEIWGQIGTIVLVGNAGANSSANNGVRFALADLGTWGSSGSAAVTALQTAIRAIGTTSDNVNFTAADVYTFQM